MILGTLSFFVFIGLLITKTSKKDSCKSIPPFFLFYTGVPLNLILKQYAEQITLPVVDNPRHRPTHFLSKFHRHSVGFSRQLVAH